MRVKFPVKPVPPDVNPKRLYHGDTQPASTYATIASEDSFAQSNAVRSFNSHGRRDAISYGSCFDVLMRSGDLGRTGASTCETVLNPSSVSPGHFGKLFTRIVDAEIVAQVLKVTNVIINNNAPANVIVVATMNNSIYVFDADDPNAQDPLWQVNLGPAWPAGALQSNSSEANSDIIGAVGIVGTPIIDRVNGLVYAVAALQETDSAGSANYTHTINVLNLVDGTFADAPTPITASVAGNSADAVQGVITFDSRQHMAFPALTLVNGQLVVAFGSHNGNLPYHGWVMSYNASTLEQTGVFISTHDSEGGGIWQSGQGLAVGDDGSLYVATANGFNTNATQVGERAQSIVRLDLKPGVQMTDYFTPADYATLNAAKSDIGASGPTVPPGSGRVVTGSTSGMLYNVAQANMGTLQNADPGTQEMNGTAGSFYSSPVYWRGSAPPQFFVWPEGDTLKSFAFVNNQLSAAPAQSNPTDLSQKGGTGGILTVSANGDTANSAIIWANMALSGNASEATQIGVLKAYAANNLSHLLWSSDQVASDALGGYAKSAPPTVGDGIVYVPSSNQVVAYGLLANLDNNGSPGTTSGTTSSDAASAPSTTAVAATTSAEGTAVLRSSSAISTIMPPDISSITDLSGSAASTIMPPGSSSIAGPTSSSRSVIACGTGAGLTTAAPAGSTAAVSVGTIAASSNSTTLLGSDTAAGSAGAAASTTGQSIGSAASLSSSVAASSLGNATLVSSTAPSDLSTGLRTSGPTALSNTGSTLAPAPAAPTRSWGTSYAPGKSISAWPTDTDTLTPSIWLDWGATVTAIPTGISDSRALSGSPVASDPARGWFSQANALALSRSSLTSTEIGLCYASGEMTAPTATPISTSTFTTAATTSPTLFTGAAVGRDAALGLYANHVPHLALAAVAMHAFLRH